MDTKGLLVRLEVKAGYDDARTEDVLRSALANRLPNMAYRIAAAAPPELVYVSARRR